MVENNGSKAEQIEVTPEMIEAFEDLFDDWRLTGRNAFILEAGGSGDLVDLARRILVWARGHRKGLEPRLLSEPPLLCPEQVL